MSFLGKIFGRKTSVTIRVTEQNKKEISEDIDSNNETPEEVSLTLNLLKHKQKEILREEKNDDYERNLFLYKIGFVNLKRVKDFIATMNTVDNIEEFNEKEKRYNKYSLQFLNSEMINSLKKIIGLKSEVHSKYDGGLPNSAIDVLKVNYKKLETDFCQYNFYKKYYSSDSSELVKSVVEVDRFVSNNRRELAEYLNGDSGKDHIYHSSNYWTAKLKPMTVLYNNIRGLIIIEIEPKYYLVLSEWDDSTKPSEKMNFKEFIKNNIIPKQ
jgi:hypothetical protein